eukprot:5186699-Pyramimonas_sp.AAC.1
MILSILEARRRPRRLCVARAGARSTAKRVASPQARWARALGPDGACPGGCALNTSCSVTSP